MRMRRKKNLDARLEACADIQLKPDESGTPANFNKIFSNGNPVELEIGCGKGRFITEIAKRKPDVNFVALERQPNVIVAAMEKIAAEGLKNVRFICTDAQCVSTLFMPGSIERIYLNFSCPFPKRRYAKHRLTYRDFLRKYVLILKPFGEIHMKTDNKAFFEFTLNEFCHEDFKLKNITFDLHNSGFEGNIETEYEARFSENGCPIYRLEATAIPNRTCIIKDEPPKTAQTEEAAQ